MWKMCIISQGKKKHALYYDFAKDMFSGSRYDIIDIYDTSKMCLINKIVK
jgi:hypothetical protein